MKNQSHLPPHLVRQIQLRTKEKCFIRQAEFLPLVQLVRELPSSSLAPARYVNERLPHHRTRTGLYQMTQGILSLLMIITRMTLWVITTLFSNVHLASCSLKLQRLFGIMSVLPAQLCYDPIARYATVSSMMGPHFRNTCKVLSSHVSFV